MERSTITFRLHAAAGERLSAKWLTEQRADLVTIAIGEERYMGRVTKVAADGDGDGVEHIDVTMWLEPSAGAGADGPVLFTLDELCRSDPHPQGMAAYDSCDGIWMETEKSG